MKYPILASFIVFALYFSYIMKKSKKTEKNLEEDFWERERMANATRRKPLEDLNYIKIPLDILPMELFTDIPQIHEFQEQLRTLSGKKIVNFSGYSNTDLKLAYGAPNINLLSEYDQNFTELITYLQSWAALLLQKPDPALPETEPETESTPAEDCKKAARTILEYAVSIGSDICASYEMLADLYQESYEEEKIAELIHNAEELHSPAKRRILAMLEQKAAGEAPK